MVFKSEPLAIDEIHKFVELAVVAVTIVVDANGIESADEADAENVIEGATEPTTVNDEQLMPEESDELYGYRLRRLMSRLRQLDRVRGSENEDQIRAALEDLDHRIEELRRFEQERSATGLSTGFEVDLSSRTAAVDRLLELAHRRVPGLIAGSDTAPSQPTGSLRVSVAPFAPAPGDVVQPTLLGAGNNFTYTETRQSFHHGNRNSRTARQA